MKCTEAIELMSDAVDYAPLSGASRITFDCHLAACRPCSLYLSQVRVTVELTATLREVSKPADDFHRYLLHRANGR